MVLWDNLADMQTYEPSVLYKEIMAQLPPLFVGEYKTYRCEAKYIRYGVLTLISAHLL
jgi:hypothetical protein